MITGSIRTDVMPAGIAPRLPISPAQPRSCQIERVNRSPFAITAMVADPDRAIVTRAVERIVDRVTADNRIIIERPHDDGETFIGSDSRVWYVAWVMHRDGQGR